MQHDRQFHNIALIGFMGVGKSTVGHLLAEQLGFELIDTDKVIEQRAGRRVSDIFAAEGEARFRELESALVTELESARDKVIATGGGLIVNPANLVSLRRHALIVCLWGSAETIYERVRHQNHRPLLQTPDPQARISELLAARGPAYREADMMVGVDYRHASEIARHVAKSFLDLTGRTR